MTEIKYSDTANSNILAFGIYAMLQSQSKEVGEYVMKQIEDFCEKKITLVPQRGVKISDNPETRRSPDKFGRTYYFEYYPEKDLVYILSIHKWDIEDLDSVPEN